MRLLLDENLPHRLRTVIKNHQVETASYKGWNGLKNGELLKVAEADGVQVLVTGDQNLVYQQSMDGRQLALVVLSAVDFTTLQEHIAKIQAALDRAIPGSFETVDCGSFGDSKRKDPVA